MLIFNVNFTDANPEVNNLVCGDNRYKFKSIHVPKMFTHSYVNANRLKDISFMSHDQYESHSIVFTVNIYF